MEKLSYVAGGAAAPCNLPARSTQTSSVINDLRNARTPVFRDGSEHASRPRVESHAVGQGNRRSGHAPMLCVKALDVERSRTSVEQEPWRNVSARGYRVQQQLTARFPELAHVDSLRCGRRIGDGVEKMSPIRKELRPRAAVLAVRVERGNEPFRRTSSRRHNVHPVSRNAEQDSGLRDSRFLPSISDSPVMPPRERRRRPRRRPSGAAPKKTQSSDCRVTRTGLPPPRFRRADEQLSIRAAEARVMKILLRRRRQKTGTAPSGEAASMPPVTENRPDSGSGIVNSTAARGRLLTDIRQAATPPRATMTAGRQRRLSTSRSP